MRAGIGTSALGPIGCILIVGDELAITEDFQDAGCTVKAIEIEVLAGRGTHLLLSLGCYGLVANRGCAIV